MSDGELRVVDRAGECDRGVIERREGREDPSSNLTSACCLSVSSVTYLIIYRRPRSSGNTHLLFPLTAFPRTASRSRFHIIEEICSRCGLPGAPDARTTADAPLFAPQARMTEGGMLKKITEAMKDLVTEANFDCSTTGISLQAMVS